jgi:oxygen-independent coproporphyrinogen-3 oxidase
LNHSLRELIAAGDVFQGYAYAYPHKTAYRRLDPPRALAAAWAEENKAALFVYAHLPFCEMRCGFCNLFTTTHPEAALVATYLDSLQRQAEAVAVALGSVCQFSRLAIGGGTPTFLSITELSRLFGLLNRFLLGSAANIPKAIEASPATVDNEKVAFLKEQGITRISLGVQSFLEAEVRALGRAQRPPTVRRALGVLSAAGFNCLNVDLIYGIAGQTVSSWERSLEEALEFAPQELYLYPLYVRPLTHLGQTGRQPLDSRLELYRAGRTYLLERGYHQVSMRLFRSHTYSPPEGPVYCCQEDGMVGLGAGARSYTTALHYSTEYAVGHAGIVKVIADFNRRTRAQFSAADYGCELDDDEQKRRYLLKSLLRVDGLDLAAYQRCFSTEVFADFPELLELPEESLAFEAGGRLRLTPRGLELSDVIGPWLWSAAVRAKMDDFVLT